MPSTPDTTLPPLVPEGLRRKMLIEIEVSADFEKRLDNQWEVEREINADRWSWRWGDPLQQGVRHLIALHKPAAVPGLPGGMPGCNHCSHGVTIGDEGGSGGEVWPCHTLQTLAGIKAGAQWVMAEQFTKWRRENGV